DVGLVLGARGDAHAVLPRPVLGAVGSVGLGPGDDDAGRAVPEHASKPDQSQRVAHRRVHAVGAQDQVGPDLLTVGEAEHALGVGSGNGAAGDEFSPRSQCRLAQQVVHVGAEGDDEPLLAEVTADDGRPGLVNDTRGPDAPAPLGDALTDAEGVEDGETVLLEVDSGSELTRFLGALVDADVESPARERRSSRETRDASTSNGDSRHGDQISNRKRRLGCVRCSGPVGRLSGGRGRGGSGPPVCAPPYSVSTVISDAGTDRRQVCPATRSSVPRQSTNAVTGPTPSTRTRTWRSSPSSSDSMTSPVRYRASPSTAGRRLRGRTARVTSPRCAVGRVNEVPAAVISAMSGCPPSVAVAGTRLALEKKRATNVDGGFW